MDNKKVASRGIRIVTVLCSVCIVLAMFFVFKTVRGVNEAAFGGTVDRNEQQLNYLQHGSPYSVYVADNDLYFYSTEQECFGNALFKVEGHRAVKLLDFAQTLGNGSFYTETPHFFINNCLYYSVKSSDPAENALIAFDVKTGEKRTVCDSLSTEETGRILDNLGSTKQVEFGADGAVQSVVFPLTEYDPNAGEYVRFGFCRVSENGIEIGDRFDGVTADGSFSLGEFAYRVDSNRLIRTDSDGNEKEIAPVYRSVSPIYVPGGRSVLIFQPKTTGVLRIDQDGTATQLFPPYGGEKVYTAVQIRDNYLYISVRRYKHVELLNSSRFKNDEAEGLWRVDILTGETEKLSGEMYEQLYIYDDSGIIGCTFSKDVVKLDFDGNMVNYIVRGTVFDHLGEFWRNTFSKAD